MDEASVTAQGNREPVRCGTLQFSSKELALISVLAALWIVSEIYLGPLINRATQVHGVIGRVFGWFLMLTMVVLTEKFGRATTMAVIASTATRIIRVGQLYSLFVGMGYALGGLTFDLLYFFPPARHLKGKTEKTYLLGVGLLSGSVALIPYILFQLVMLGYYSFTIWFPLYIPNMVKSVALSIVGTSIGISFRSQIGSWAVRTRAGKS